MQSTGEFRRRRSAQSRAPGRGRRGFNIFVLTTLLVSATLLALVLLQRDFETPALTGDLDEDTIATFAVLDVGHALSVAVVTDDGHGLVYDFGQTRDGAENVIAPFFAEHGVDRIDYAILSHPHQDHVGGFPALMESVQIDSYLDPVIETTNQTYLQSLEMLEERGIDATAARQGESFTLGEHVEVEILWPPDELLTDTGGDHLINDNSTVARVTAGEVSLMLTGDIEEESELQLVDTYAEDLDVDILQLAHHGSYTSSHDTFLRHTDPEIAIIPVGADNSYGHPHSEVIQRLRAHEIETYRTDIDGTVTIQTDGEGYAVSTTGSETSWVTPP